MAMDSVFTESKLMRHVKKEQQEQGTASFCI
jgi:hypothetical protein